MLIARASASWLRIAVLGLGLSALSACGGGGDGGPSLERIEITPAEASAPLGTTQQFVATAVYSDESHEDVTDVVAWESTDTAVATLASDGLATSKGLGDTTVRASLKNITGSASLTVTAAVATGLQLTPATSTIAKGLTVQLAATATFTDGSSRAVTSEATWTSAAASVASVGNGVADKGLVTGHQEGAARIAAAFGGLSAGADLTVTAAIPVAIAVTPAVATIPNGLTKQFVATATLSDASVQDVTALADWASSDTAVAEVGDGEGTKGLAKGHAAGVAQVSASYSGFSDEAELTVTSAVLQGVAVTPATSSIPKGRSQTFIATGTYSDGSTQDLTSSVTWSSTDVNVATISNAAGSNGTAQGKATGNVTIRAVDAATTLSGQASLSVTAAELVSLAVTPPAPSIAKGRSQQFTATGTYTDGSVRDLSTAVTWSSSDTAIASVSNANGSKGLAAADGAAIGSVTIGAVEPATHISADAQLAVTAAELVGLDVAPTKPAVPNGSSLQFSAIGRYSDNTHQDLTAVVTWTSSDAAVAELSNAAGSRGLALAKSVGTTTVGASFSGQSASTSLLVTDATLSSIQLTPVNAKLAAGFTRQYAAIGIYSDNSTHDLTPVATWATTAAAVATVSNAAGSQGLVHAVAAGSATVQASVGGVTGTSALTVTNATLNSVAVTPANPSAAKGTTKQFTATGTFSDSSTQDLTTQADWSSSDPAIATVSSSDGSRGLATAVATGSANISATLKGVSGATKLTVSSATLDKITVTPSPAAVAKGTTLTMMATGTYSDSSTADITADVTWSSSDSASATVTNGGAFNSGTHGVVTGVAEGSVTLKAALGGVSGSVPLTVTPAVLTSIAVTPANQTVAKGIGVTYTATGTYSDNTSADITTAVTWSSSDTAVATVSNANGSQGVAATVATGAVTVSAELSGKTGSTGLTVSAAVLQSIEVTPKTPTIPNGTTQQFKATGTYSDASSRDITTDVTWASSSVAVASISNAAGNQGLASSVAAGTTTISASSGSGAATVTGSTVLSVTSAALQNITVTPASGTVAVGYFREFRAMGSFADGSTKDITEDVSWTTFSDTVATVSNVAGAKGRVSGVAAGSTTVLASMAGINAHATVTVTDAILTSIAVTPADSSISRGATLQFTATGTFSDASTLDLTHQVTWASSNSAAATIDENGLATGGDTWLARTTISASKAVGDGTVTGSTSLRRSL